MRNTLRMVLLLLPLTLQPQPHDISTGPIVFTGTGPGTPMFVGAGGAAGTIAWRLTYFVDGTKITAAQVAIQGANATTAVGCSSAAYVTIGNAGSNSVELINPSASAAQGNVAVKSYYSCIRANVLAITGSAGTITVVVSGWRYFFEFPTQTSPLDTGQLDAFSRLRTSSPTTLFDSQFQYGLQPLLWQSVLTGTGTAAADANLASVTMTVAANGDQVIRQSHRYFRYQPGKSQLIVFTAVMGAIKANTRQRIGYFDAQNGLFFQQNGTALSVVQRSFTSGSAVDTTVNQSSWNLDKLDGTGPTGILLDTSKAQIFLIDFQWLGVGRVRFGVDIGGQTIYCHEILNANALSSVYMTTANLPVRYELTMTGATTSTTMTQICQSVISEGGFEDSRGLLFTANTGAPSISVSTRKPILSIRPKTTFSGVTNRGLIEPMEADILAVSGSTWLVEIVYNGTLTGASFASVNANSLTEVDTSASAISGGTVLLSFYASGQSRTVASGELGTLLGKLQTLTLDVAGTVPDILSIVVTSSSGATVGNASLNWKEIY